MEMELEIPVYLFTGFLESGKTTFIQETLEDENFNDGAKTLLIVCEEGEEEYDTDKFASNNIVIVNVEEPEDITEEYFSFLTEKHDIERVIVEYNGMWNVDDLINNTPEAWVLYQNMMFADATTFLTYNANMRNLVGDKIKLCDAVIFNRFKDEMDKSDFHQIVRTFNRRTDILYEFAPNRVEADNIPDPLPYDMEKNFIEVEDEDYAIWYRDVNEETQDYIGKTIRIKGRILTGGNLPPEWFVFGRHVMTCCVEDIEFCGVVCRGDMRLKRSIQRHKNGDWIIAEGVVTMEKHEIYHNEHGPILNVKIIENADAPEEEVAVFY